MGAELDLENRDVNKLNENLSAIEFHDVLGEPDALHSMDCVWKNSFCCFNCTLAWCYTPALRICEIECGIYKKFLDFCLGGFVAPCCETCGLCLSKIAVKQ